MWICTGYICGAMTQYIFWGKDYISLPFFQLLFAHVDAKAAPIVFVFNLFFLGFWFNVLFLLGCFYSCYVIEIKKLLFINSGATYSDNSL